MKTSLQIMAELTQTIQAPMTIYDHLEKKRLIIQQAIVGDLRIDEYILDWLHTLVVLQIYLRQTIDPDGDSAECNIAYLENRLRAEKPAVKGYSAHLEAEAVRRSVPNPLSPDRPFNIPDLLTYLIRQLRTLTFDEGNGPVNFIQALVNQRHQHAHYINDMMNRDHTAFSKESWDIVVPYIEAIGKAISFILTYLEVANFVYGDTVVFPKHFRGLQPSEIIEKHQERIEALFGVPYKRKLKVVRK